MSSNFLLIGEPPDSAWAKGLAYGLQPLGLLDYASGGADSMLRLDRREYQAAILEASAADSLPAFIKQLHRGSPGLPIVVVTASPTWQHARQAFLAGAVDYVPKSMEFEPVIAAVREVLAWPRQLLSQVDR